METMTKMPTLKEQIQTRNVRYRLGVAVLCLKPPVEKPVMKNGVSTLMTEPAIFITRVGDGKMGPFTEQFDTSQQGVKEYVDFVDSFIHNNPAAARKAGLAKLNDERPPAKIMNWDNMSVEQIRTVLEATRIDLTWAMEYELLRPDKVTDLTGELVDGGPREEVIDLIEEIWEHGFNSDIERSDSAPTL